MDIHFEDDFFERKDEKLPIPVQDYKARLCPPKWFYNASEDDECTADALKFKADHLYFEEHFEEALDCYKHLIKDFYEANNYMRRNIVESIIRCHIRIGNLQESRNLAEEFHLSSKTNDMKTVSLDLLSEIYGKVQEYKEQCEVLKKLISLHPLNHHYWTEMSKCYANTFKVSLLCLQEDRMVESEEDAEQDSEMTLSKGIVASCLIRASLILKSVQNSARTFVQEKISCLEQEVNLQLEVLNLPEEFVSQAIKIYGQDVYGEKFTGEVSDEEPGDLESSKFRETENIRFNDFEKFWFRWILDYRTFPDFPI